MFTCPLLGKLNKKICPGQINEDSLKIIYKLLHDSLFLSIIFFLLALIAEAVLPGIIISHIGFSKIVIIILTNVFLIKILTVKVMPEKIVENNKSKNNSLKKITIPLLILGVLLIFNSQLGMNIFLNIFILFIASAIGYLSYRILFLDE